MVEKKKKELRKLHVYHRQNQVKNVPNMDKNKERNLLDSVQDWKGCIQKVLKQ